MTVLSALLRAAPLVMLAAPPMTFETALEAAPAFCTALQNGNPPPTLSQFVSTSAGARGFFVHYLTGDEYVCADAPTPPEALLEACKQSNKDVREIMLMNVVMSAATALAHERAGNDAQAATAKRTSTRASILVNALWEDFEPACRALKAAVAAERGVTVLFTEDGAERNGGEGETGDSAIVLPVDAEAAVDEWSAFITRWMYDDKQLSRIDTALASLG